jgi:hypothetical protein
MAMTRRLSPAPLYGAPIDDAERAAQMRMRALAVHVEERLLCDTLRLARLCPRLTCRKADRCRGHPRWCLETTGEAVPAEVRDWAEQLVVADNNDERVEDVAASFPDQALAHACWVAGLDARVRRDRRRAPPPSSGGA